MALFNRNIPSKVMGGEGSSGEASSSAQDRPPAAGWPAPAPRAASPATPPSPAKEKEMEKQAQRNSLLDIMPAKQRPGAEGGPARTGAPGRPGAETYIGSETVIEGKILAQGEVCIDGAFKGEIISNNHVVVGPAGKLEGTVEAKSVLISGQVVGNLHVLERLEIQATGELVGDLETQPGALIIEKGARVEGRCVMGLGGSAQPKKQNVAKQDAAQVAKTPPTG